MHVPGYPVTPDPDIQRIPLKQGNPTQAILLIWSIDEPSFSLSHCGLLICSTICVKPAVPCFPYACCCAGERASFYFVLAPPAHPASIDGPAPAIGGVGCWRSNLAQRVLAE